MARSPVTKIGVNLEFLLKLLPMIMIMLRTYLSSVPLKNMNRIPIDKVIEFNS